jgi:co-chaperonin GroES (HSP10)
VRFPIRLLDDLVAIQVLDYAEVGQTIKLPDWRKTLQGKVIEKGSSCKELKKGARVIFGAAVGMEASVGGKNIRIMRLEDIDGTVDER